MPSGVFFLVWLQWQIVLTLTFFLKFFVLFPPKLMTTLEIQLPFSCCVWLLSPLTLVSMFFSFDKLNRSLMCLQCKKKKCFSSIIDIPILKKEICHLYLYKDTFLKKRIPILYFQGVLLRFCSYNEYRK